MKRLLIVGAGGHGHSVAEAVLAATEYELVGFLDDAAARVTSIWGRPVLGPLCDAYEHRELAEAAIVAIGNNRLREEVHTRLRNAGFDLATVVHPRAVVSPSAVTGEGCAIMAGAVIGTQANLGDGVIVNCGAVVDHHCRVDDFAHVGANATMAGGAVVGRGAWMQAGSAIGYGVRLVPGEVLEPAEGRSAR